ncbi:MAG: ATP-binding protein [Rothia sp. (in: high G+C Gram-positive bacteria)]|nr:ATP-binding protein [Rothia sp. (in: high G+C Gram-positive bacteria)]
MSKLRGVDPILLALISMVIGLGIGILSMWAVNKSDRERAQWADVEEPSISDGAAEVLAVIGRAYVVVDAVDGVVQASPGAYALGLVKGHTVVSDEMISMIHQVRSRGIIVEREIELSRGTVNKTLLNIDLRIAPVGDEYILVLADDRTEITRVQAVRNDFVANVSHELKTPVGAIGLMAEAIESSADDEESVKYFSTRLQKESKRLASLVQDVIELSRLQSTDVVRKSQLVDVNKLVAAAVEHNRITAEGKNITLIVGGNVQRPVHGDPELLGTALRNLIENAIRYSPEKTKVGIGLTEKQGTVRISVKDQGPGIPDDEQDRIFERFYRVDPARSRQTGGTGLGLSIVKHIMGQHGGEISLWSVPGEGSTFTMTLPTVDELTEQDLLNSESDGVQSNIKKTPSGSSVAATDKKDTI